MGFFLVRVYLKSLVLVLFLGAAAVSSWIYWGGDDVFQEKHRHQKLDEMEQKGAEVFTLADLSGQKRSLSEFKGKIVILNFWASWCEPCVTEMPSMVKLINHFSGRVVMLAVSNDSSQKEIKEFLQSFGQEVKSPYLTVLWDQDRKIAEQYQVQRLPETFILDQDLKLIRKVVGLADWYNQDTLSFFKTLIHQKR